MPLVNLKHFFATYYPALLDLALVLFLLSVSPLFFYKLGASSLGNWDEAWYADIARHILRSGDWFNLTFNGQPFTDHPPLGPWLISLAFKLFGVNEYATRLPSALAGLACLVATYFLGKELFNRLVGVAAGLSLVSATWFIYRARTGNLDTLLTLFVITSLLFAFKSLRNKRYLLLFASSLALLFLSKAALPFTIIPSLILIFLGSTLKFSDYLLVAILSGSVFVVWLGLQLGRGLEFFFWHISHGARGVSPQKLDLSHYLKIIDYLHNGIGRWFWPAILGVIVSSFWRQRRFYVLLVFIASYLLPFGFSNDGQIWHLIPVYPIALILFYGSLTTLATKFKFRWAMNPILIIFALFISFNQAKQNWYQFIDIPAFISDEAILSKEAGKYPDKYYVDGDFNPVATFYADKPVEKIYFNDLVPLFKSKGTFLLITTQGRLNQPQIDKLTYQVLKTDRDKLLIRKP